MSVCLSISPSPVKIPARTVIYRVLAHSIKCTHESGRWDYDHWDVALHFVLCSGLKCLPNYPHDWTATGIGWTIRGIEEHRTVSRHIARGGQNGEPATNSDTKKWAEKYRTGRRRWSCGGQYNMNIHCVCLFVQLPHVSACLPLSLVTVFIRVICHFTFE